MEVVMINGVHVLLYSRDAEVDRAFLRDVFELRGVDAGNGWLILALPPTEIAVHPGSGDSVQHHADHDLLGAVIYFMCDDLPATMTELEKKGVECTEVRTAEWGIATSISLPSGGAIGLYQPLHATAFGRGEPRSS
jgi:catechol 2,3-dioxygenase-like lactoylglutathione lyase family enzyme